MKVTLFGTGYVGLVTGACLAESGHQVMCMDVDENKIDKLRNGIIPIYEPGLDRMVAENVEQDRLHFTSDANEAIAFAELLFIAVGTPAGEDGSADLQYVLGVARKIGETMQRPAIIITKSTVPVGTSEKVRDTIQQALTQRGEDIEFHVASNPEFLKEGAAISDFMKPDRIIIGTDSAHVRKRLGELFAPFNRSSDRTIYMDIRAAELTKYAANAMLATKISFMNEISRLAECLGADIEQVRHGIGSDPRIGYQFIYPGIGYGGSCFPKDVKALVRTAAATGMNMQLLGAVDDVNERQKTHLVSLIHRHYNGNLSGKVFALWGLSFKPGTDDMREAPSRVIMEALWEAGARVQAYDPEAMQEAERIYGHRSELQLTGTRDAAIHGADALIICTEWQHFRAADFEHLSRQLTDQVVFDGRNVYDPDTVSQYGLTYYGIGRGASLKPSVKE
ncbi:MAG: UDP-glucose/GDP-mannose dehydrogenase family protein [Pseudohongiellaceae bacterium]